MNIGELDRPDQQPTPIKGLPGIMARSINRDMESIYQGANRGVLADVDVLNRINEVRGASVYVWGCIGLCVWGGKGHVLGGRAR